MKPRTKTGGRSAGTPNRQTATTREWVTNLIQKNHSQIEADLKKISPKDRLIILEKLMQYSVPKMSSAKVSIDELSDQHLDTLITEISKSIQNENNN